MTTFNDRALINRALIISHLISHLRRITPRDPDTDAGDTSQPHDLIRTESQCYRYEFSNAWVADYLAILLPPWSGPATGGLAEPASLNPRTVNRNDDRTVKIWTEKFDER